MEWTFLSATVLLTVIADPLGNIPLFISSMQNVAPERRVRVIIRECLIAFAVLLLSMLFGRQFLDLLHLGDETLRVAGGAILFLIAINMVFPGTGAKLGSEETNNEPFIVPVAVPLISGPSAVVTSMMIAGSDPSRMVEWIGAATVTIAITTAVFLGSNRLGNLLGAPVLAAVERLMGLFLTAISIEMLMGGVADYIRHLGT